MTQGVTQQDAFYSARLENLRSRKFAWLEEVLAKQVVSQALVRRDFLSTAGLSGISRQFGSPASAAEIAQQRRRIVEAKSAASGFNKRLAPLGTAGGPRWWPNTSRHSTSMHLWSVMRCTSLICGDGAGKRLQQAFEPPDGQILLLPVRTLFLTHLHSDHTVDYPNLLLYGWYSGLDGVAPPLKLCFRAWSPVRVQRRHSSLARQPDFRLGTWIFRETQAAVHSVGRNLIVLNARTESEIDAAFVELARQRVGDLIVTRDQATLTAWYSPTSGSEGNLCTHRECVEPGAGIPGVARADLLGNVAVQVIKHKTNVAIDIPIQTRSVDCLPPTRNAICGP
jgi:hypothetical protein